MFILLLSKTDSDSKSAIISSLRVWHVRAGDQTQETGECQPSFKYHQVVKDNAGRRLLSLSSS